MSVAIANPLPAARPAAAAATSASTAASRILLLASTSILAGIIWDISWHRTIGRDTFWTPAHMAIYLGGILGGVTSGWLVLANTFFASSAVRNQNVRLWGFYGPLGAWIVIWGSFAMLLSAPFDNWWHNAYGVDVKILSPPHTVLALGMWSIVLGSLMLVLKEQNVADENNAPSRRGYFLYASGVLVVMAGVFLIEHSFPNQHRTFTFYVMSTATYPLYLLGMARASKYRWAGTCIGLIYMGLVALAAWVLPMFPGHPRLGPIHNRIDHFVPLPFPLLLVVPGFGLDLVRYWIGHDRGAARDWLLVFAAGIIFLGLFLLTQWYFSQFLISPKAYGWFFATDRHWGYQENLGPWRNQYWHLLNPTYDPPLTVRNFFLALAVSIVSCRLGLWLGNWMARVKR